MKMSRQRKLQLKYQRAGKCEACGKPRKHYKALCDACAMKRRDYERQYHGHQAWLPGSAGKPTYQVRQELIRKAVQLYKRKLSGYDIARIIGVGPKTVYRWLRQAKVKMSGLGRKRKS